MMLPSYIYSAVMQHNAISSQPRNCVVDYNFAATVRLPVRYVDPAAVELPRSLRSLRLEGRCIDPADAAICAYGNSFTRNPSVATDSHTATRARQMAIATAAHAKHMSRAGSSVENI